MIFSLAFRLIFKRLLIGFCFSYISLTTAFFLLETFVRQLKRFDLLFFSKNFIGLFFVRAEIFIPLSFLLATIYTISTLKERSEIQILQVSGLSKRFLSLPFYLFALLLVFCSYSNSEWIAPKVHPWIKAKPSKRKLKIESNIHHKLLPDNSRIVYQIEQNKMYDLYWIHSQNEIWHCKEVVFENNEPLGLYIDIFKRNSKNLLEKSATFDSFPLPRSFLTAKKTPEYQETLPLSKTFHLLSNHSLKMVSDLARVRTNLLYQFFHPLYLFLFATAFLPLLFTSRRPFRPYLLYLLALLFFLIFYSIIKTCIILGEHYVISPWITLALLPLLSQGALTYRLWKV